MVGRIIKILTDHSRNETLTETQEPRKVIISILYPAAKSWVPIRQGFYMDLFHPSQEQFLAKWIAKGVSEDYLRSLKTNIYQNASISMDSKEYPVILYSPGCSLDRDSCVFVLQGLVEAGYIVITIGALFETDCTYLPNGEIIKMAACLDKNDFTYEEFAELRDVRKNDIRFLLDQLENLNQSDELLKGKLNLNQIGMAGFSLGAISGFEAAAEDKRIKALAMFEGCMFFSTVEDKLNKGAGMDTPTLLIKRHDSTYEQMLKKTKGWFQDLECEEFKSEQRLIEDISRTQEQLYRFLNGYKSFIKIDFSDHTSFSDYYILTNEVCFENFGGQNNVYKVHEIMLEAAKRFFNEFLLNKTGDYQEFILNNDRYSELKVIDGTGEILVS